MTPSSLVSGGCTTKHSLTMEVTAIIVVGEVDAIFGVWYVFCLFVGILLSLLLEIVVQSAVLRLVSG